MALFVYCSCVPGVRQLRVARIRYARGLRIRRRAARPRVWWHWMNGNISEEGIKLDLEWMHRIGLAGFHNFDAAMATPQVVPQRLSYMTPEWKSAFVYATKVWRISSEWKRASPARRAGARAGGPWVPPSHGMKKYVWSEL